MSRRVLFVIPSFAGGGAERVLVQLLRNLDRGRFEPLVVVFHSDNAYKQEFPPDIKVVSLDKGGPADFFRIILKLAQIIRTERPALICTFLTYANYVSILAMAWSRFSVPIVVTEHNILSIVLNKGTHRFIKRTLVRRLYRTADAVIAVSEGVKTDLVREINVPGERCVVVHNSVDLRRIEEGRAEAVDHPWFHSEVPLIIACGRLTPSKNFPLLLGAFRRLVARRNARLVILGDGPDRASLEELARRWGVDRQVAFLGFQPNPFKFIARARVFALSSSWEGFGNVIIEAMACGTAVVSTDCAFGPREIISQSVDGLLVPEGDEPSLALSLESLIENEGLRRRIASAGQRRAQDFRVERSALEYQAIFDALAEKRPLPAGR